MTIDVTERVWRHTDEERREKHRLTTPGPWDHEPDKVQWIDPVTNLDCLAVRNPMGVWCGYVGVPSEHPSYGRPYDDLNNLGLNVHGGLTFSGGCMEDAPEGWGVCHVPFAGRSDDIWWLGFDCGHAFDLLPGMADILGRIERPTPPRWARETYRNLTYVKAECADLARQLMAF